MNSRSWTVVAALLATGTAHSAGAQVPEHFHTLTTPPSAVGTCTEPPPSRGAAAVALRGRELVMKTRDPAGEREILVYADRTGRVVRYAETTMYSAGTNVSTNDAIVAALRPTGRWTGIHMGGTTQVVDSGGIRAGHLIRPTLHSTRRATQPLSAAELARVASLTGWMQTRCPLR